METKSFNIRFSKLFNGKETTITQIECAFGVIESLCNLKFQRVFDGSQILNIAFLTDDKKENEKMCPYSIKKDGKNGILAHGFYPSGSRQGLSGDLHFDNENWTIEKTTPGCGKYNFIYVSLHEICHCFGCFHQNEPDSIMAPCYRHGCSVENRFEAVSESDKKLLQEMYGKPTEGRSVEVRVVFDSKNAKVMLRKIFKIFKL